MKNTFKMIAFIAMILISTEIVAQKPFIIDGTVSKGLADVKYYLYDQE